MGYYAKMGGINKLDVKNNPYGCYIIAVDFDGTLVQDEFPKIGYIHQPVVDTIKQLQEIPFVRLILWTCRVDEKLEEAVKWCEEQGIHFNAINDNVDENRCHHTTNSRKVFAHKYIEDRNVGVDDAWQTKHFIEEIRKEINKCLLQQL